MGGVLFSSSTHVVRQLLKERLRLWFREGTHRVKNMWRASAETYKCLIWPVVLSQWISKSPAGQKKLGARRVAAHIDKEISF